MPLLVNGIIEGTPGSEDKGNSVMKKEKIKICFAASSGGHYEQLMMLKPLMEKYDSFVVTEKTDYNAKAKGEKRTICIK